MITKRIPGQDARFGTLYVNASDYDQLTANVHELLEALEYMCSIGVTVPRRDSNKAMEKAHAAIAKVKGEIK